MILTVELVVAYLLGALTLLVVLEKYGQRIGVWALKRKLSQLTTNGSIYSTAPIGPVYSTAPSTNHDDLVGPKFPPDTQFPAVMDEYLHPKP